MSLIPRQIGSLDDYLDRICAQIQLGQDQYEVAVNRYTKVGEWLGDEESSIISLEPAVMPQGSMLQRTTIRPTRAGTVSVPFDLDSVCCCEIDPTRVSSQEVFASILDRLREHGTLRQLIDNAEKLHPAGRKCIRLAYLSDDFYLDVVPVCKDPSDPDGIRLLISKPDQWKTAPQTIDTWRRTDPFRFAAWLDACCEVDKQVKNARLRASVSPVPAQEPTHAKAPLRRIIQLMKNFRDRYFLEENCRPTSILLSTLAGRHYGGETSIVAGFESVLTGILDEISDARPSRIVVVNPADELAPHDGGFEDLAAPLTNEAYSKFCSMITDMTTWLSTARDARGVEKVAAVLSQRIDHLVVRNAFGSAEDDVRDAGTSGLLGTSKEDHSILVLSEPKPTNVARPVRSSTFHLHG